MNAVTTTQPPGGEPRTGIVLCAVCGARAVARITRDFLCADHALAELAVRVDAHRQRPDEK
ncbi:MAG: hypothetical protein R6X29_10340 [Acidimicrobiia bacterium]